ncbi:MULTISPECIES: hypothetical protein [unclassified Cryobacterium]|uniref:hypothetical protein n=1 Tax=unclassified Cryobacterium TaxID=2649013 RepID=UPI00106A60C3|nr:MULTISPECIES: hypothetical protein [unclassified Cryobacterium]TFC53677.1 hypothetical protein E3O68_10600 [Cryobacterium sp. TMB3-1-2]TFC58988.1 hypothetical protein E3O60_10825 [Cryobacterium sp. TMB1-7]TFC75096.1 hypothetical protein E3T21_00275 [Cryobacterium sp. TMB3-15]TFC75232.1 hypothetical protein E3T22_12820 [Cryobacterium sp. TMB3-10]TFD41509.1 hypothetical protein E3T58_10705 [Cryobacterium sp. TMB3-12]
MSRKRRAEQLRAIAAHVLTAPILLEGDADELLTVMRTGARAAGIPETDRASATQPARVVVVAIQRDARRSSLVKAASLLRELNDHIAPDAVRIIVVQSRRSKLAPPKLQRLVASEVLFHVALALANVVPGQKERTLRQRFGLTTLDAAGFRILRFG